VDSAPYLEETGSLNRGAALGYPPLRVSPPLPRSTSARSSTAAAAGTRPNPKHFRKSFFLTVAASTDDADASAADFPELVAEALTESAIVRDADNGATPRIERCSEGCAREKRVH
tara:strand:+ start:61 stop:405 length:345 start_codon:yes stop_codon:yes gene_type:complete